MTSVFITIPWFLPAYKAGGPIQSIANMVNALDENFQFYIYTSNKDLDGSSIPVNKTDEWIEFNTNTKVWYSTMPNCKKNLLQQVNFIKPNILYIIGIFDKQFNIIPLLYAKANNIIISLRGMLHPGALSQKSFKKKIFLSLLKLLGWHRNNYFHATDDAEKSFAKKMLGNNAKIFVAGNFPAQLTPTPMLQKTPGELILISIGLISPMKNYMQVLLALKALGNKTVLKIQYNIYGPVKDETYWNKCREVINSLPNNMKVNYHGAIASSKIQQALWESHVFILPSKSENFGHAIIEALSAARPVITSTTTPWNNLQASMAGINTNPDDVLQLQNAIHFFVKKNQSEMEQWGQGANVYAKTAINLQKLKEQYTTMFSLHCKKNNK